MANPNPQNLLSKEQLKQAEKRGRWLRRHNGHDVVSVQIDGAVVGVCRDCDKSMVAKWEREEN